MKGFAKTILWLGIAAAAAAQPADFNFQVRVAPTEQKLAQEPGGNVHFYQFVSAEMLEGKTVKGLPFSAQSVTETTQVLADGNRIHRQSTSAIYRDSEGRVRREQSLEGMLPFGPGAKQSIVFISDPVAGVNYTLDPAQHTGEKLPAGGPEFGKATAGIRMAFKTPPPENGMRVRHMETLDAAPRQESLGTQIIEGVQAQGTRSVTTIPAGQIGNDRPIEIVSERWYSPDLQIVVMTRHSDPRMGETVYKLTNLERSEPAATLFTVPADYRVADDSMRRK